MNPEAAISRARVLWDKMLDGGGEPTDDEAAELIANLKFITVRDRLLADIPGIDESMQDLLLGQTKQSPHWQRVDRASDVLFQLHLRTDGSDAAPVLTSLGIIQWWEGHGSKAYQCFQRALEADPEYRLAQLTDHLVREGFLSDWATDRQTAYQPPHTRGPEIGGMGMAKQFRLDQRTAALGSRFKLGLFGLSSPCPTAPQQYRRRRVTRIQACPKSVSIHGQAGI